MAKRKAKERNYANIFTPDDLTKQIDRSRETLGLKSRTEVVRLGQTLLEKWISYALSTEDLAFWTIIQQIEMIDLQNKAGADNLTE